MRNLASLRPRSLGVLSMAAAVTGLLLTGLLVTATDRSEDRSAAERFSADAREQVAILDRDIDADLNVLQSLLAFFAASQFVDEQEFADFASSVGHENPIRRQAAQS